MCKFVSDSVESKVVKVVDVQKHIDDLCVEYYGQSIDGRSCLWESMYRAYQMGYENGFIQERRVSS